MWEFQGNLTKYLNVGKLTRLQIVSKLIIEIIWTLQQTMMSAVVIQINSWGHLSFHILGLTPRMWGFSIIHKIGGFTCFLKTSTKFTKAGSGILPLLFKNDLTLLLFKDQTQIRL